MGAETFQLNWKIIWNVTRSGKIMCDASPTKNQLWITHRVEIYIQKFGLDEIKIREGSGREV